MQSRIFGLTKWQTGQTLRMVDNSFDHHIKIILEYANEKKKNALKNLEKMHQKVEILFLVLGMQANSKRLVFSSFLQFYIHSKRCMYTREKAIEKCGLVWQYISSPRSATLWQKKNKNKILQMWETLLGYYY